MTHTRPWTVSKLSMFLLPLLSVVGACSDMPAEPFQRGPAGPERAVSVAEGKRAQAAEIALAEIAASVQGRNLRGAEDEILRLEAQLPGIGGLYIDTATDRLTVLVGDLNHRGRAIQVVQALAARTPGGIPSKAGLATSEVDVRKADYRFSELVGWSRVLRGDLLAISGFISIDADERLNRVRITVEDDAARAAVERATAASGIPSGVVYVELGAPIHAAQATLTSRVRPTGGGMQISSFFGGRCTLGWNVTTSSGETGFLTAAHCSDNGTGSGQTGETMYQVTNVSNDAVGTVTINNPFNRPMCFDPNTGQAWTGQCTQADAMFVESSQGSKRVARTKGVASNNVRGTRDFASWWTSVGSIAPNYVGLSADKVGRTTGWTRGTVAGTCVDFVVNAPGGTHQYIAECQGEITNAAIGTGDSGGPVFASTNSTTNALRPLGIVIGGGPFTQTAADGAKYCNSNCRLVFSNWANINYHLGRTFNPS